MQTVDAEGDAQMSGINGISAATLFAIVNAVNSQAEGKGKGKINKPPAPWRSKEDHAALIAAGKCTRCGGKGHWFKKLSQIYLAKEAYQYGSPFTIEVLLNKCFYTDAFMDSGCLCYSAFNLSFVKRHNLPQLPIESRELKLAKNDTQRRAINNITCVDMDIDGKYKRIWGYVIEDLAYDMILGDPWMRDNNAVYNARKRSIRLGQQGELTVRAKGWDKKLKPGLMAKVNCLKVNTGSAHQILGAHFAAISMRTRKIRDDNIKIFAASISDINKALEVRKKKTPEEIKAELPREIEQNAQYFTEDEKHELSPNRPGLDTKIELSKDENGREKEIPFGPLYDMSREELLVLGRTLTDHLDRNWIRASASPGGAPVLFAKKPGGGLRFCVDYRELNAITVKDRYPLPLVKETLRQVARSTWVSKVDVRAAFHKLRVCEGDNKKQYSEHAMDLSNGW
ncbi:hypothetical protein K3495_g8857 [Podosphaera aphanis]|nr:hypothetical protein K3495_g8857 [Podosphaera aphanis]